MMGIKIRVFTSLPRNVSLEELVPEDHFYGRLGARLDQRASHGRPAPRGRHGFELRCRVRAGRASGATGGPVWSKVVAARMGLLGGKVWCAWPNSRKEPL
jgi:hypothetical protein